MNKLPLYLLNDNEVSVVNFKNLYYILYKSKIHNQMSEEYFMTHHLFAYVLNGEKNIYTDTQHLCIRKGDCVFVQKGLYIFSDIHAEKGSFESLLLFMDDSLINEFVSNQKISAEKQRINNPIFMISTSDEIRLYMDTIICYMKSKLIFDENLTRLKLFELLYLMLNTEKSGDFLRFISYMNQRPKKELTAFMESSYTKPLNIEEYALLSGRSLSSFKREFKQLYNTTPAEWIRKKRLSKAKDLLENSLSSIAQTGYDVGYENISHFISLFKKEYGITPKQFSSKNNF